MVLDEENEEVWVETLHSLVELMEKDKEEEEEEDICISASCSIMLLPLAFRTSVAIATIEAGG
jgi:hypothetical protein